MTIPRTSTGGGNVIKSKEDDLVVPVSESFWALFLRRNLIIDYFMQSLCFVLNDWQNKQQIVLVVPGRDSFNLPTVKELADYFPMRKKGQRIDDVRQLPIPLYQLRDLTGVRMENLEVVGGSYTKQMLVMYATYEDITKVRLADSILAGFQIREDPESEHPWPVDSKDLHIITVDYFRYYKVHSVIALLKVGAEITVQSNLLIRTGFLADEIELYDVEKEEQSVVYH